MATTTTTTTGRPDDDDLLAWLRRMSANEPNARAEVCNRVYERLRAIARKIMQGRDRGTFQPTDLVHGAFLKLIAGEREWETAKHFMDVAAEAMRQVLIDHVRVCRAKKRGGGRTREGGDAIDRCVRSFEDRGIALLDLDGAIARLGEEYPDAARFAVLKLFGGLSVEQVRDVMGMKQRSAERLWEVAKVRLRGWLDGWEPVAGAPAALPPSPPKLPPSTSAAKRRVAARDEAERPPAGRTPRARRTGGASEARRNDPGGSRAHPTA